MLRSRTRAFRQLWIGATVCAGAFGATAASSALTYVTSFPSEVSRQQLAATTGRDTGLSVLLGPVASIDTVGGYTVYKGFVFLGTIGAIWGVLAATRLFRGEEDVGRWQVMLAGSTRPARATAATLAAFAAAIGVIFAGTTLLVVWAGRNPDVGFGVAETVLYGLTIVVPPAVFVAIGAVTSQLGRTRRAATSLGMILFAAAFALRMVADSGHGTRWLLWTTPFGWSERVRPFTENALLPLVPAALAVVVLCGAAVVLSSRTRHRRWPFRLADVARLRPFGLKSTFGLAARLEMGTLLAWSAGVFAAGVMFGVIAKMTTANLPESLEDTLDKFGVHGTFAAQYFGVAFLLVATAVALLPGGQVGAAAAEETSGHVVRALAGTTPQRDVVRRPTGARRSGDGGRGNAGRVWRLARCKEPGCRRSTRHVARCRTQRRSHRVLALGIGAVVLAISPRAASGAVYVIVMWSLLVDLLASMVAGLSWLDPRRCITTCGSLPPSTPLRERSWSPPRPRSPCVHWPRLPSQAGIANGLNRDSGRYARGDAQAADLRRVPHPLRDGRPLGRHAGSRAASTVGPSLR